MYTNCPECGTVFRISTPELRVAEGYVRCGHCSATFNALATLADEPPPTVTLRHLTPAPGPETGGTASPAAALSEPEAEPEAEPEPEPQPEPAPLPGFPAERESPPAPPALEAAATDVPLIVSEDTLEFDIPEGSWSNFFDASPPAAPDADADADEPVPEAAVDLAAEIQAEVAAEFVSAPATPGDDAPAGGADVGTGIGSETVDQAGLHRALSAEAGGFSLDDDADWQSLLEEVPDDGEQEETPEPVFVIGEELPRTPVEEPVLAGPAWDEPAPGVTRTPAPLPADFAVHLPRDAEALEPEAGGAGPAAPGSYSADRPFIWEPPAPPPAAKPLHHRAYLAGSVLLALLLVIQLLHQQRDYLATKPSLTVPLQRTYAALGLSLWPAWDLRSYELRNSEAVADRTGALDILARIAVVGNERVGLPLVRITLRDRFSKPIGTRVFQPAEYLSDNPRPREPVSPGTLIPVKVSLQDPGTAAQGFDVDVCVMSRRDGIICRAERDPFAR